VRRALDWLWRGRTIAELKAQGRLGPRGSELLRRGWICVEVAERALRPSPLLTNGAADGPARELLREAVFWALSAERFSRDETTEPGDGSVRALWAQADRQQLVDAAGGEGALHALETCLLRERFDEFAELSPEEQASQARDLAAFARTLLTNIEAPRVKLDKFYTQRVLRTGGSFALAALLLLLVSYARNWRERDRDLARDRPYKTSSTYPVAGCKSPQQDCPESPFYFFHTLEEDRPWVEIDLGSKKRFTAIKVVNREDCCGDRTVPLAIEISSDRKSWREVARRTEAFNAWYTNISPVSARYVRAIALKKTTFHLKRFAVLR
jgi:hypothetical protein